MTGLFLQNVADLVVIGGLTGNVYEASKDTYYQNTDYMRFSDSFQEKLFAGLDAFRGVEPKGWAYGDYRLNDQMGYCDDLHAAFWQSYDPEHDLPGQRYILSEILPYPDMDEEKNFPTIGSYQDETDFIYIKYYVCDEDGGPDTLLIDGQPSERFWSLNHVINQVQLSGQNLPYTGKPGVYTIPEMVTSKAGSLYVPAFESRRSAVYVTGHEITHQALKNVNDLFQKNSHKAFVQFGYTKDDHALYTASHKFYVLAADNDILYNKNAEENMAQKAEIHTVKNFFNHGSEVFRHGMK